MIPSASEKPGARDLPDDLAEFFEATSLPLPKDRPDAILDNVKDERAHQIYKAELAYLRGDFEPAILCFQESEADNAARLRSCSLAITAAIGSGNYHLYQQIESYLKEVINKDIAANVTAAAELSLATALIGATAVNMIPEWLKNGDFSALTSQQLRLDAAFKRARYFQFLKQYESALAVAETALNIVEPTEGLSTRDIYLRLACASACWALGQEDEAKHRLSDVMNDYLPHGFITPFSESVMDFYGLQEQLITRDFPSYYDAIAEQISHIIPNWIELHNQLTKDSITYILTVREGQMARLAARGVPFKKIAERFQISPGTLNNNMQIIYQKLNIRGKKELSKYVL